MFDFAKKSPVKLKCVGLEGWIIRRRARAFFREYVTQRAWLLKGGGKMYLIVEQKLYNPEDYFDRLKKAVAPGCCGLLVECVPYAQMEEVVRASECRIFHLCYGERSERWPLDDQRYAYLTAYMDADGMVGSYSLDFEKAADSHYKFYAEDALALEKHVMHKFPGMSFPEAMREMVRAIPGDEIWRSESMFVALLARLGIEYEEFHFD